MVSLWVALDCAVAPITILKLLAGVSPSLGRWLIAWSEKKGKLSTILHIQKMEDFLASEERS